MALSDTYVVTLNFNDGSGDHVITNFGGDNLLCAKGFSKCERFCDNDYMSRVNYVKFKILDESTLRTKFLLANKIIDCSITKNGSDFFTGIIFPNYNLYNRPNNIIGSKYQFKPLPVEASDKMILLDEKTASTYSYDDYKVFDSGNKSSSIIHQILYDAGFSDSDIEGGIDDITVTVDYFYVDVDEEKTFRELIDTLLYEHGCAQNWTAAGKYSHGQWIVTSVSSSGTISDANISLTMDVAKSRTNDEAIEVEWTTLATLENVTLYGENVPIGSDGMPSGITMPDSSYYPVDGKVKDIYQTYRTTWVEYRLEDYDVGLVLASNQSIMWNGESGITVETETHYAKKSQIIFENDSGASKKLYWFDIVGDAVVKKDIEYVKREIVADTRKIREYKSKYIFSSSVANKLCVGIENTMIYGDFIYKFKSIQEYTPGAVYLLNSTKNGINTNVLVMERVERCESTLYEYTMVGLTEYASQSTIARTVVGSAMRALILTGAILVVACRGSSVPNVNYVCDASADQTEINAAITAVSDAGGGIVSVVAGAYYVSDEIVPKSNVQLLLEDGAVIERTANTEIIFSDSSSLDNFEISGGTLKRPTGGSDTYETSLIRIENASNIRIDNVKLENGLYRTLKIQDCSNIVVRGCYVFGEIARQQIYVVGNGEIYDNVVDGEKTERSPAHVIYGISAIGDSEVKPLVVKRNTIKDMYGKTYPCYAMSAYGYNVVMESNYINNLRCNNTLLSPIGIVVGQYNHTIMNNVISNLAGDRDAEKGAITITDSVSTNNCKISNNRIQNCSLYAAIFNKGVDNIVLDNNYCIDNGQLIDRGGCESTTPPMIFDETVPNTDGGTTLYARSSDFAYEGEYSYKITKNVAAGTSGVFDVVDANSSTDMHGTIASIEYTFTMQIRVPSSGGPLGTEIYLILYDYESGWANTFQAAVNTYDEWQEVTVTRAIRSDATGVVARLFFANAASNGEYIYIDNARLYPTGINNEHENQYKESP